MSEKLRVLHLITDLGKGGAERFLIDLCAELQKRDDIEFVIGSLFSNNQYKHLTQEFPIVELGFQTFSFRKKNECLGYKKLLEDFKPHVIHTHRFLAEFLSSYYVDPSIKYICHGHDNMIQFNSLSFPLSKEKLIWWLEKQVLIIQKYKRVPTVFIANSQNTFSFFQMKICHNQKKCSVKLLNIGFQWSRFYKERNDYPSTERPLKIVNVGSFQKKKNQIFILEVAEALKAKGLSFEIHLLGDGEERSNVEAACKVKGLDQITYFHGNVDNVEEWLWNSHIYLHTAYYEPFGLVFLEAMAAGLPIVTLDGKGNRDLIHHGKNGFIFSEQSPDVFADTIIGIANNLEKYNLIRNTAQGFCKKYDIQEISRKHMLLYQELCKN